MQKISTRSIQSQLILNFTMAILVPSIITTVVGVMLIYKQVIMRAESKMLSDLNSATEIYRNKISHIENLTRLTSVRSLIIAALIKRDTAFLHKDLRRILAREKLDILTIVDSRGYVVARGQNSGIVNDLLLHDPFIARAIQTHKFVTGTDIVSADYLKNESLDLLKQATFEVIPTPKAKPRKTNIETSGMMLKAAIPIFDDKGKFVGVLLGGILLNRNFEIVDKVKEVIYGHEKYKGMEIGTATIFQNDLRISTNVKNEDGSRAIGTLISEDVYNEVIEKGNQYVGEAFVVNAWYLSAYKPIKGIDDKIIGIYYVGILKKPFDDILRNTLITFIAIAMGGIVLIVMISIRQAKRISQPLKIIEGAANKIAGGNYDQEIKIEAPREIELLASSINQMAKELKKEKEELEEWGNKLEVKVKERTDEIKKIHSQLFRSEKLASLGKLAAGVAHEINNPLTGILTNASLLRDDLPENDPKREDVDIIVKETIRCREIVKRLLDFARQTKPQKQLININNIIDNIILLVRNQTSFRNVSIEKNLSNSIPDILADKDQIQQVFINIIINAAEAMSKGGSLKIETSLDSKGEAIIIKFTDTGPGIPEHLKEKIFDPFFTTKENGTGLGLAISYGIIEQHGGEIDLDSTIGVGTTFKIKLPVIMQESA